MRDIEIYKRASIDRRYFSKILSNSNYRPNKNTTVAFSLALKLDQKDANSLLRTAGYSLLENETFDLVIHFCLEKEIYNIDSINQALNYFSLNPLKHCPNKYMPINSVIYTILISLYLFSQIDITKNASIFTIILRGILYKFHFSIEEMPRLSDFWVLVDPQ